MDNKDTGFLLQEQNIKLHRVWFKQMCQLLGINVLYQPPVDSSKTYNLYGELKSNYYEPITVACIFDEHPSQQTMRKLGWDAEMQDNEVIIHVPYDLPKLQAGALFTIPAGLDNAEPRVFRVLKMNNIAIYPASIACKLGPIYWNNDDAALTKEFSSTNFNMLADESEEYEH